jgi:hypothetical protein
VEDLPAGALDGGLEQRLIADKPMKLLGIAGAR